MGVFTRLTDIINSNINAILEKAEDPNKIIRMVIQEMEDTLIEVRSSAAKAIADQKDVERRLKKLEKAQAEWEKKAELAISKGRDDLAKGALIEKAKVADMAAHMEEELQHLADALSRHEEDVIKLDAKLREAKAKKATLQARHKTVSNQVRVRRNLYDNRIQDAFDRFEKVETRLDRMEAEAESFDLGKGQTLADEINSLESNEEIEKELAALKAKTANDGGSPKKKAAE
ncbi:phage shock protein A [Kordiimonas sediminis]|uniref:Phage shock protein A n=1 Tax=Kordiimonas sediminis TaxID=1735581 RepID=A0A919AN35_9PROT|nr:phage shock protein PspA [Kordiimonas sediminis]GHF16477.1 phage shock protein A [Kordiimonas sediminis]